MDIGKTTLIRNDFSKACQIKLIESDDIQKLEYEVNSFILEGEINHIINVKSVDIIPVGVNYIAKILYS